MSKIKVAVFGCGAIAQRRHIPEYAANENVELVAFADPIVERAEEMAETYGVKLTPVTKNCLQTKRWMP